MSDPVRITGLFAGIIEPPFVRSRELEDLAGEVIATCDEFEPIQTAVRDAGLSVEYVWETKPFDPLKDEYKPHVIAKVSKANPLWLSLTGTHLVIQFRRWFWERFDDTQRRAVIHHELTHIDVDEPDDQGRIPISLRHHDVEDFTRTMRRFGPVIPGREAFVRAYVDWSAENPESTLLEVDHLGERVVAGMMDAAEAGSEAVRPIMAMAERTGTQITIEAQGRSVTFGGRKVDPETGEILG